MARRPELANQALCATKLSSGRPCNHPLSFHSEKKRCRALGCKCVRWTAKSRVAAKA